jgi:hypothetical protein
MLSTFHRSSLPGDVLELRILEIAALNAYGARPTPAGAAADHDTSNRCQTFTMQSKLLPR